MRLCGKCGTWDFKPGLGCLSCGYPFNQFASPTSRVYAPGVSLGDTRDGNYVTAGKTRRQEEDDS